MLDLFYPPQPPVPQGARVHTLYPPEDGAQVESARPQCRGNLAAALVARRAKRDKKLQQLRQYLSKPRRVKEMKTALKIPQVHVYLAMLHDVQSYGIASNKRYWLP
jgi:(p)ppGpp synthase/HD superfamily hydrolase